MEGESESGKWRISRKELVVEVELVVVRKVMVREEEEQGQEGAEKAQA